jgi:hypothetical protein
MLNATGKPSSGAIHLLLFFFIVALPKFTMAQDSSARAAGVPRLVKFRGVLKTVSGEPLNGMVGISFAIYAAATGGTPLWEETQNVSFSQGSYTVFLGQSRSTGIPAEIFLSGQSRWLGVRILSPGEEEQPRVFLTSVPYAMKAVDADTLGGLPPSAFVKAEGVPQEPVLVGSSAPESAVTQPSFSSATVTVTTPGGSSGAIPQFSSNSSIVNSPIRNLNGKIVTKNLENVRFADQFTCPSSPGCNGASDLGAQINAAYASCPATGCHIKIPAGKYTISTPIEFTTLQKTVVLECDAGTSNKEVYPDWGVTELDYTRTSGAAITMDTGGGTGSGIQGCMLRGPGTNTRTVGVQLAHASKQTYRDLFISGFGVGLQFGDWVLLDNFYNLQLENNGNNLYAPPSITVGTGESIGFFGGVFTNKSTSSLSTTCVDFEGGQAIVVSFYNVSFDQCGVTLNIRGGQQFLFSGSHFEDPSAATNSAFLTIGDNCVSCQVILSGSDVFETHVSSRTEFIRLGGGARLTILGGIYLAAEPMAQVITSTHPANAVTVIGAEKVNEVGAWVKGTYSSFTTIDPREYRPLTVSGGPIVLGGDPTINGSISSAALSAPQSWVFPNSSGTVMLSDASGNSFIKGSMTVGGNIAVTGSVNAPSLTVTGAKHFRIDDPVDPANKYLYHSSVESSDMMNIYSGTALLDRNGEAEVQLPRWLEALNRDFRYQLTCIGGFAPVYVAQEIIGNRFRISGGRPGLKISWQVTGIRHDPYAESHPSPVEVEKPAGERGHYLNPSLSGASSDKIVEKP